MPKTNLVASEKKNRQEFEKWINTRVDDLLKNNMIIDFINLEKHFLYSCKDSKNFVFTINYTKRYRQADMNIYPLAYQMYLEKNYHNLEDGLIHELCHLHTIPAADKARERFLDEKDLMETFEELTQIIAEYAKRLKNSK